MIKAIKKAYEWLDKKTFIILNGDKLLKEREEQEIRIAQFQNDIIKLRKNKIRIRNKKHQEIRDKAAKVLSLSTLVAVIMIFIFTIMYI